MISHPTRTRYCSTYHQTRDCYDLSQCRRPVVCAPCQTVEALRQQQGAPACCEPATETEPSSQEIPLKREGHGSPGTAAEQAKAVDVKSERYFPWSLCQAGSGLTSNDPRYRES